MHNYHKLKYNPVKDYSQYKKNDNYYKWIGKQIPTTRNLKKIMNLFYSKALSALPEPKSFFTEHNRQNKNL